MEQCEHSQPAWLRVQPLFKAALSSPRIALRPPSLFQAVVPNPLSSLAGHSAVSQRISIRKDMAISIREGRYRNDRSAAVTSKHQVAVLCLDCLHCNLADRTEPGRLKFGRFSLHDSPFTKRTPPGCATGRGRRRSVLLRETVPAPQLGH
jgi:hypothetical protein